MLLNDIEVAKMLNSSYFTNENESTIKRRVRGFLSDMGIKPLKQTREEYLYLETDLYNIIKCSQSQKGKDRRTGKLPGPSAESAYERVLGRL